MISTNYVNVFKKDSLSTLRVDPTKTIFISGAGISQDHPSNLPVGNKLTKWYIDTMLGYYANNFLEFWNLHFPPIAKSVHEDGSVSIPKDPIRPKNLETPRLEFIIGEMDKMDRCLNAAGFHKSENKDRYRRKSSLKLLEYFQDAEPNDVHHRLAQFLKAGSEMITANFDVCLEKAGGLTLDTTETQHYTVTSSLEWANMQYFRHF